MSTCEQPVQTDPDNRQTPPNYKPVGGLNTEQRWIHETTGLCVELQRFAIMNHMRNPRTSRLNCYEYRLVIRPNGRGSPGKCVEKSTEKDPEKMAAGWMQNHPDGIFKPGETV